ncbi:hypothetical protein Pyn_36800 [Prunus yedoensis var. nudiflora]|uniref:Uncharacterized protein n=1 Tax=Prunus yedoensis var. nudiflora TaxID=2094558 RepID=A0A314Y511_PRUYE|nr:hypothetical protein Pyn_36800 [Prunus yedoensis var. nudiflora]
MAESEQQPEEAYAIKLQGDVPRYVLGPLYPLHPPDEVVRIWSERSDDPLPFTMEFDWKSTWEALRPFKGWPCKTSEVECVAKKNFKAKKPNSPQKKRAPIPILVKVRRGHFPLTKMLGRIGTPPTMIQTEIIGANLSTNSDVIVAECQQNIQPSGSREVDHGIIDDTSHTPDHQVVSLNLETTLVDSTTIRDEVQILPNHTSDFLDPTGHSTDDRIFQTTSADQMANASGELQAIPVILSNGPASRIPQPSSDMLIPILTDQQHEVGEPIMPDPLSVWVPTAGTLVEGGGERPPSTDQDDLIQSLLDHVSIIC